MTPSPKKEINNQKETRVILFPFHPRNINKTCRMDVTFQTSIDRTTLCIVALPPVKPQKILVKRCELELNPRRFAKTKKAVAKA